MGIRLSLSQLFDYASKRVECRVAPQEWMVEVTNRCNLKCPMCPRETTPFPPEDMSLDHFKHLLERHERLEAVWTYGFGEPLLNPHISEMIRWAKRQGKTVCLSTNATLLSAERASELFATSLDYIILAVDGVDGAYAQNRYPARLPEVERKIEGFLALKLKTGSRIHVTVQMVRMMNNRDQARRFRSRWKRPGVDAIRVRDDLSGIPGVTPAPTARRGRRRPCFFLWRGPLFVEASGTVIPCPYYHGSEPIAEILTRSALEAWNSDAMRSLRRAHLEGDLSAFPICQRCPRHQPARPLACVSFFVNTHHIRRIFPRLEDFQRRLSMKFFE